MRAADVIKASKSLSGRQNIPQLTVRLNRLNPGTTPEHGFRLRLLCLMVWTFHDRTCRPNQLTSFKPIAISGREYFNLLINRPTADAILSRLTLNLKANQGQDIARQLVQEADVLVEN